MRTFELLERMYELAVWDGQGRQLLPLFGYDDKVEAYAPAQEALETFYRVHQLAYVPEIVKTVD